LLIYSLYPSDEFQKLRLSTTGKSKSSDSQDDSADGEGNQRGGAWFNFATAFERLSFSTDLEWATISDKLVGYILPEWSKLIPGYVRRLQRELSMAPGSLADEIWQEAHDPAINPEIQYSATVRVSNDLCEEEKEFLARRKRVATVALAKYLGLREKDVNPDDVPIIAMCGSGGGLRALVAGSGSLLAAAQDGLFDCVTYTSGVSGSCWLQALFNSSITERNLPRLVDHLKARIGIHIAYPPEAFSLLVSAPTNKYLLSGVVEKLKGDPKSDFGLVDVYGLLLAARLLVPKGELGVNDIDFKLSNQREYIKLGQNPLPIYTAVRHEIPHADPNSPKHTPSVSEEAKEQAKAKAWFQWFEITPYEVFCEEFAAGIPTWALGRKFDNGTDVPSSHGFHLPEIRMPFLMGTFGSAFCATLSHYYREIRPLVKSLTGFGALDELISGHNEDLSKVHPIDPASFPNFIQGMDGRLPQTVPDSAYQADYIQLMDAGMSNNLPIYPLLRPGRQVDIIIAFDASADIKTDNWLAVADGYAKKRGIMGWPVGIGWPKKTDSPAKTAEDLEAAQAHSSSEAQQKVEDAQVDQAVRRMESGASDGGETREGRQHAKYNQRDPESGELGYCTVWVGSTQEQSSKPPLSSKAIDEDTTWKLLEPTAGLAVVYLPFLTNDRVPGVDPASSDYMSTWNFVYTPENIDNVVALARANFDEAKDQVRATVRAVYERKKKMRLEREAHIEHLKYRRLLRLGIADKLGEGDHFS
jgi:phospholipase A2